VDVPAQRCCLGLETTPEAFIGHLVLVFREVRRVLRGDGTLWLNLGDSYADKSLVGIPWRAAMALQADGWYLRSEVVWGKPNPMPESVTDRPTKAHEQVFLLTKSPRYFYDAEAVREPLKGAAGSRFDRGKTGENGMGRVQDGDREDNPAGRNLRTVWTIATRPSRVSHFAVMAPALAERCIKAGTSEHGCCAACGAPWVRIVERVGLPRERSGSHNNVPGREGGGISGMTNLSGAKLAAWKAAHPDTHLGWRPSCPCEPSAPAPCRVLDPFGGSGTTAAVAAVLGRVGSLCEPNQAYIDIVPLRFQEIAKIVSRFARPEPTQPKLKRLKELPQRT
jgi:DNA modification methylase